MFGAKKGWLVIFKMSSFQQHCKQKHTRIKSINADAVDDDDGGGGPGLSAAAAEANT